VPRLQFSKVEGLGNDFLLLDRLDGLDDGELVRLREAAPRLCDRRTGVGGDGILIVAPPTEGGSTATMIVINHDGSRPEMCGNGLRCVAQRLAEQTGKDQVRVDTDAGVRNCQVRSDENGTAEVSVSMGPAIRLGDQAPASAAPRLFIGVSMGNPHAICFVDADEDPEALARELGPQVEIDPAYPDRTNVEFCRPDADGLTLWVWERGCGITGACGTGACATAAAAVEAGHAKADRDLTVRLPGGDLSIRVPANPSDEVIMTGPARVAFEGSVTL